MGKNQQQSNNGIDLIIAGSIMFVPGSYATFIVVGVSQHWDGFHQYMLPSLD